MKNCSLVGLYWGAHAKARPDAFRESLGRVSKMWADGLINPRVGLALPLREANAAVAYFRRAASRPGKVVLTMDAAISYPDGPPRSKNGTTRSSATPPNPGRPRTRRPTGASRKEASPRPHH